MLESYRSLTDFLGLVLGPSSKVVLYDLTLDPPAVVAISGGTLEGRGLGSPLTDLARSYLESGEWKDLDYGVDLPGRTRDGRSLRTCHFYIKEEGKPVGMLCINTDTTQYQQLCRQLCRLSGLEGILDTVPVKGSGSMRLYCETITDTDLTGMIQASMQECVPDANGARLTQPQKLAVIEQLARRGAFRIKGAVGAVAAALGCSVPSVYRYLTQIKGQPGMEDVLI